MDKCQELGFPTDVVIFVNLIQCTASTLFSFEEATILCTLVDTRHITNTSADSSLQFDEKIFLYPSQLTS